MLWLTLIVGLLASALLMRVTCTVRVQNQPRPSVTLACQAGGLHFRQQQLWPRKRRYPSAKPDVDRMALLAELRRSGQLRRISRHIRLHRFTVTAMFSLSDAAHAAQLCGLFNTLPGLLPPAWRGLLRIQVWPDFWSGRQQVAAECIFSFRPGMLLADAARLMTVLHRQRTRPRKEG